MLLKQCRFKWILKHEPKIQAELNDRTKKKMEKIMDIKGKE